ncbi:MAG: DNA mismatch repair protein MutT, partial [Lachnospiraceae bacterium]|nr:DNA mismatch repair protein MutT [Lachnospiraceae bacterium]
NPQEGDNYFVDVYRFTGDFAESDLHLQAEETDGWMLADIGQIRALAREGIFLHYDSIKKAFDN